MESLLAPLQAPPPTEAESNNADPFALLMSSSSPSSSRSTPAKTTSPVSQPQTPPRRATKQAATMTTPTSARTGALSNPVSPLNKAVAALSNEAAIDGVETLKNEVRRLREQLAKERGEFVTGARKLQQQQRKKVERLRQQAQRQVAQLQHRQRQTLLKLRALQMHSARGPADAADDVSELKAQLQLLQQQKNNAKSEGTSHALRQVSRVRRSLKTCFLEAAHDPHVVNEPLTLHVSAVGAEMVVEWFRDTQGKLTPVAPSVGNDKVYVPSVDDVGSVVRCRITAMLPTDLYSTFDPVLHTVSHEVVSSKIQLSEDTLTALSAFVQRQEASFQLRLVRHPDMANKAVLGEVKLKLTHKAVTLKQARKHLVKMSWGQGTVEARLLVVKKDDADRVDVSILLGAQLFGFRVDASSRDLVVAAVRLFAAQYEPRLADRRLEFLVAGFNADHADALLSQQAVTRLSRRPSMSLSTLSVSSMLSAATAPESATPEAPETAPSEQTEVESANFSVGVGGWTEHGDDDDDDDEWHTDDVARATRALTLTDAPATPSLSRAQLSSMMKAPPASANASRRRRARHQRHGTATSTASLQP